MGSRGGCVVSHAIDDADFPLRPNKSGARKYKPPYTKMFSSTLFHNEKSCANVK